MNAAQIVGDVIHDLLGVNVVVAQQVDVVVLSLQGPVLRPGISRAVQLQLPHLSNAKKLLFLYKPGGASVPDPDPEPDPDPPDPHVFGPPGSDPDPLVRGMDPDPSIIMQK
jgi:hypothetical protein